MGWLGRYVVKRIVWAIVVTAFGMVAALLASGGPT